MITDCSYGGTNRAARVMFSDLGITFSFVDFRDPEIVKAAIRPNTKLIFSETPANPTLTLTDLRVRFFPYRTTGSTFNTVFEMVVVVVVSE